MTRIVAGAARGRPLKVPARGTRPTSDRVRESCFSALASELDARDEAWSGQRVLDLFAGSGALGLEALSRGAASAVLVESGREAARILRANAETVGLAGVIVVERDALRLGAPGAQAASALPATVVFADPPYELAADSLRACLESLAGAGWIAHDAAVVVERASRDRELPMPEAWFDGRCRAFGDTSLWYGRATSTDAKEAD